jgi:hypothetical protein
MFQGNIGKTANLNSGFRMPFSGMKKEHNNNG